MGVLFTISGPSGVGKGTLVKRLVRENSELELSISCTTRPPRVGEKDGREYFFLTREEFLKRQAENDFLECDEHFGNYYGTPKSFVLERLKEKSVILEIDVVGALNARRELGNKVKTVLIFVVPPNMEALEERLSGRQSESEEEKQDRIARAEFELSKRTEYDYILVNDCLEEAYQELLAMIKKETEIK